MIKHLALFTFAFISACSSTPEKKGPDWIRQPTRVVDNGYIVYVGISTDPSPDRARFKAEGMALEDLANECSLIPKGARIEDRYVQAEQKYQNTAYVKLALEFQECEEAKRATDPQAIKKIASLGFTDQLKKFQDLTETGEMPESGEAMAINAPSETPAPPVRQPGWNDNTMFIATRQYIAYQKEVVVLSPPSAYAPGTPQATSFTNQIVTPTQTIAATTKTNPMMAKSTFSGTPGRDSITSQARPAALQPAHSTGYHSMSMPKTPGVPKHAPQKRHGRGRRHRD